MGAYHLPVLLQPTIDALDVRPDGDNAEAMKEMMGGVTTLSLTHAVRDAEIDGLKIRRGQHLGLIENRVKRDKHRYYTTKHSFLKEFFFIILR